MWGSREPSGYLRTAVTLISTPGREGEFSLTMATVFWLTLSANV